MKVRFTFLSLLLVGLIGISEVQAKAGGFRGTIERPGSALSENWQAYGNSITAGYCGLTCQDDSYFVYYARAASEALDATIHYDSDAIAGHTTRQVRNQMSRAELAAADTLVFSAGGNDFLEARAAFRSSCNLNNLQRKTGIDRSTGLPLEPHVGWVAEWDALMERVASDVRDDARVRTMRVYYPGVNADLSRSCGSTAQFNIFLPMLLAAGDYMCNTAWERGYDCADSLWALNCDMGNIPDCPTTYTQWVELGGDDFDGNFGDPRSLGKLVRDNIHPNQTGHADIGKAFDLLGY